MSLSLFLSLSLSLSTFSLNLAVSRRLFLSLSQTLGLSVYYSVCLSGVSLFIFLYIRLSRDVFLPVCLSVYLSLYLVVFFVKSQQFLLSPEPISKNCGDVLANAGNSTAAGCVLSAGSGVKMSDFHRSLVDDFVTNEKAGDAVPFSAGLTINNRLLFTRAFINRQR